MEFKEILKEFLEEKKLTQKEFAEKIGVKQSQRFFARNSLVTEKAIWVSKMQPNTTMMTMKAILLVQAEIRVMMPRTVITTPQI